MLKAFQLLKNGFTNNDLQILDFSTNRHHLGNFEDVLNTFSDSDKMTFVFGIELFAGKEDEERIESEFYFNGKTRTRLKADGRGEKAKTYFKLVYVKGAFGKGKIETLSILSKDKIEFKAIGFK